MKAVLLILLSAALSGSLNAQSISTGKADTNGSCSPATTGNHNTFVIKCGIDSLQGKKMLELLNKVLANQLDPTVVMDKLDQLIAASKQAQVVNAPNGIGNIGGTLVNPTVNNFGPPPLKVTFSSVDEKPLNEKYEYMLHVKVTVNTVMTPVSLAFICSGDIAEISPGSGAFTMPRIGVDDNRKNVGFIYYQSPSMSPDLPMDAYIYSHKPVVLQNVVKAVFNQ